MTWNCVLQYWPWIFGLVHEGGLQVCFGDNDGVRFSLIRGTGGSFVASWLMEYHLNREADNNLCLWFARVPTEANISDFPSRGAYHPMLTGRCDQSVEASACFESLKCKFVAGNA